MIARSLPPPGPALRLAWDAALAGQDPAAKERVRRASRSFGGWSAIAPLAHRHAVSPLVFAGLAQAGDAVPRPALAELERDAAAQRRKSFLLAAELALLARRLAAAGISLLPLKGPLLSARLFGDVSARPLTDLDLLVRPADLEAAHGVLCSEGYAPRSEVLRTHRSLTQRFCHEAQYWHPEKKVLVELHWTIHSWTDAATDALWASSRPATLSGAPIRELDDAHLLAMLSDHGAHHVWCRLKWLLDVAVLLKNLGPGGVGRASQVLDRFGAGRAVAQAAVLCAWLEGRPADRVAGAPQVSGLAARAVHALAQPADWLWTLSPAEALAQQIYTFQVKRYLSGRAQWRRLFFNRKDLEAVALPRALHWAYPLLRPGLWAGRKIGKLVQRRTGAT
jgi:hypothetical protein